MKSLSIFIFLILLSLGSQAQWQLVQNISWENMDRGTVDSQGNLFVVNQKGDLAKFSPDGQLILEYSPMLNIHVSQINANTQLKVLLFYEDLQSFTLLNRYLTSPILYSLSKFNLGYVSTLTITPQHDLWVLDITDFSLKKLDIQREVVLDNKSLSTLLNREEAKDAKLYAHQNRIYLSVPKSGLYVFDNIGNYLFKDENLIFEVAFFRDELYYENSDQLVLKNINTNQERYLPVPPVNKKQLLYQNDQLYLFRSDGFSIYKYLSNFKTD